MVGKIVPPGFSYVRAIRYNYRRINFLAAIREVSRSCHPGLPPERTGRYGRVTRDPVPALRGCSAAELRGIDPERE